ncbi:MAG: paraquat-inducible protein A [Verrucomicrobium sp.]|nr:paraquat-inducible protein A [Verrucomicrobium sp.]
MKEKPAALLPSRLSLSLLFLLYLLGAVPSAWKATAETQGATGAFIQILQRYSLQNEGAQALHRYREKHPILGMLVGSPLRQGLRLPDYEEADQALHAEVNGLLKQVRRHLAAAAWWSCFLLNWSACYVAGVMLWTRRFTARSVLFALTGVSVIFFVVGIVAPAMVIWTAPSLPMDTGTFSFVLQYEVRGIVAVIWELITTGHWIIGGLLFLFSVVTPLTKASLTCAAVASDSRERNRKIGRFLHSIGKWSMADVFVAGVFLALYALRSRQATNSIACLGIYYFIGYCLLSMTTTELLNHSGAVSGGARADRRMGRRGAALLGAALACVIAGTTLYTYEQYTVKGRQKLSAPSTPAKLGKEHLPVPR